MDSAAAPATNQVIRSYMVLRNAIGVIAVGLTFVVFLGNWAIFSHHRFACLLPIGNQLPDSLSGYYYSHMRDVFVVGMCAAGVFLFFYRGDDRWERWLTNAAGAFALAIALFPTSQPHVSPGCGPVTLILPQPAPHESDLAKVHTGCLIGLMATIALVVWRYTRDHSEEQKSKMVAEDQEVERNSGLKSRHNKWYYGCIAAMIAAGIFALIQEFMFSNQVKADAPWLFYAELVAFVAFGVAWFVKGRAARQFRNGVRSAKATLGRVNQRRQSKIPVGG
jgi:hypothetical protein